MAARLGELLLESGAQLIECNPVVVHERGAVALDASVAGAMYDVIVVGGGFAGVTAAREAALRGCSVMLLEARERLGGRTWSAQWRGMPIEYGGAWVHWHQPHTWSEISRAGLKVELSDDAAGGRVVRGQERRTGAIADPGRAGAPRLGPVRRRRRGGAARCPTTRSTRSIALARFDRLSIAGRLAELALSEEEREFWWPSSSRWPTRRWSRPGRCRCCAGMRCRATASP